MKQLKLLALALSLIGIFGCKKDVVQPTEPEFVEKYIVTGYVDNTYTEFNMNGKGECSGTNPNGDSIKICKEINFYSVANSEITLSIKRSWNVLKEKLVLDSLLTKNDTVNWYTAEFINFQDFVDEFHIGEYKYNSLVDESSTSITLNKETYFSFYQDKSNFHFNVDTMLVDNELEMIYLAGTLSSLNSKGYPDNAEVIELENIHFSFCLKNKSIWD